jgi:hypothetical protein
MAQPIFITCILTTAWLLASATEKVYAQDASSTVLGSCNIVQQNLNVSNGSTVINQVDCTPQRPEDAFSLRYVWLDGTNSSLMLAGVFDPALKPLVGSVQTIMQNQVYHTVRELTQRFGGSATSRMREMFEAPGGARPEYSVLGEKGVVQVTSGLERDILTSRPIKIYEGSGNIVLPDMPAIATILNTDKWPGNYKMTYYDRAFRIFDFMNGRLTGGDAERAAFQCTLLFRYVDREELSNYFRDLEELNSLNAKRPMKGTGPVLQQAERRSPDALRNKAVDAMLYFGAQSWPEDFMIAVSDILPGTNDSCPDPYNIQLTALPRQLFTLVVVIEAVKENVEIQNTNFLTDAQEGLHK